MSCDHPNSRKTRWGFCRACHAGSLMADPAIRATQAAACRQAMIDDPGLAKRRARPQLAWIPPRYRRRYTGLRKYYGAESARAMIRDIIAAETAKEEI